MLRNRSWGGLLAVTAGLLTAGAAPASADAPIEGIWSFNGGKVGIKAQPDGTFTGTVVAPTRFAQCTHPVGEDMWTRITRMKDGSYWGLHQWFFETEACAVNRTLGLTAFRVLQKEESRFLRVCFSEPGSGLQPTIASDGTPSNTTFGCADSARISALPEDSPGSAARFVTLPGSKGCIPKKALRIRIHNPKNDPLSKIAVTLRSGKLRRRATIKRRPDGAVAILRLKGLPKLTFTVTVRLKTVLGRQLTRKRRYNICGVKSKRRRGHQRPLGRASPQDSQLVPG